MVTNKRKIISYIVGLLGLVSSCSDRLDNPVGYDLIGRNTNITLKEAILDSPDISLSFTPSRSAYGHPFTRTGEEIDSLGHYRSTQLIKFDGLPTDITINEANLILTVSKVHLRGEMTVKTYALTESWDQYECNWFEAKKERPWEADWESPQLKLEDHTVFTPSIKDSIIIPIDPQTVQDWVKKRYDTPGLALIAAGGLVDFYSTESDTLHPYLRLQYVQKGETKQNDFLPFRDTFISYLEPDPQRDKELLLGSGYPYRAMLRFEIPDSLKRILVLDARLILRPNSDLGVLLDREIQCYTAQRAWEDNTIRGPSLSENYSIADVEPDSVSFYATVFFRDWLLESDRNFGLVLLVTDELDEFGVVGFDNRPGPDGLGPQIELKYYPAQEPWL